MISLYNSKGDCLLNSFTNLSIPYLNYLNFNNSNKKIIYFTDGSYMDLYINNDYHTIFTENLLNRIRKMNLDHINESIEEKNYFVIVKKPFDNNGIGLFKIKYSINNNEYNSLTVLLKTNGEIIYLNTNIDEVNNGLYCFIKDKNSEGENIDLYGCIDSNKNTIVPFKYSSIEKFENGLGMVTLDENNGFINKKGEVTIPFSKNYQSKYFSDGLLPVSSEDQSTIKYIDTLGKTVFSIKYPDNEKSFKSGLVKDDSKVLEHNYYNTKGNFVFSTSGIYSLPYVNNISKVSKIDIKNSFGLMDTKGKMVLPLKYSEIFYHIGDFIYPNNVDNELIFISYETQNQNFDINGSKFELNSYNFQDSFNKSKRYIINGLIKVELNSEIFYVDINGKEYKYQ
jgi:hypothetical protein